MSINFIPVAVVGAGPYGLSVASYLQKLGVPHRVFGRPMGSWRTQMPAGMFLKSEGFASNLAQPDGEFTLREFCERAGYEYREYGHPIPLRVFVEYGLAFQRRFVPSVEDTVVSEIRRDGSGFMLRLCTGEELIANQVVIATGFHDFRHIPPVLAALPTKFVSHTGGRRDYSEFKGRKVCVVGAGASATDVAAALYAERAEAHLVSRAPELLWLSRRIERPWFERWFKRDVLGGGRFGQGHFYTDGAYLFRHLPRSARLRISRTYLGPRGGWPVRECVERMPKSLGYSIANAEVAAGRVLLTLTGCDGERRQIEAEHVIAGTGYRLDVHRLSFLDRGLVGAIDTLQGAPVLSAHFESSVRGLYFVGYSALYSFGPLMRFVGGTRFASARVIHNLERVTRNCVPAGGEAPRLAPFNPLRGSSVLLPSKKTGDSCPN